MRSKRQVLPILLFAGAFLLCSVSAWAATPAYMTLEGASQGQIDGSCTKPGHENTIVIYSFGHNIRVPTDPQSGQRTGSRVHGPLKILKEFDKSSPKLYRALVTGESLTRVEIKFYRISPEGQEENYYTIRLDDALIVSITPSFPTSFIGEYEAYGHMETVAFTYRRIQWEYLPDGIVFEDDWRVPAP